MSLTHLPQSSDGANYNALSKVNDQNLPPADLSIDWDNPSLASAACDVAGLTQVSPRFWCRMTLAASTGALVLLEWHAVWDNVTNTLPILARTTTGVFTITLPSYVSNEYDASMGTTSNIPVNLSGATIKLEGSTFGFTNSSASGNVITLHTANSSASPNDLVGSNIIVIGYGG